MPLRGQSLINDVRNPETKVAIQAQRNVPTYPVQPGEDALRRDAHQPKGFKRFGTPSLWQAQPLNHGYSDLLHASTDLTSILLALDVDKTRLGERKGNPAKGAVEGEYRLLAAHPPIRSRRQQR